MTTPTQQDADAIRLAAVRLRLAAAHIGPAPEEARRTAEDLDRLAEHVEGFTSWERAALAQACAVFQSIEADDWAPGQPPSAAALLGLAGALDRMTTDPPPAPLLRLTFVMPDGTERGEACTVARALELLAQAQREPTTWRTFRIEPIQPHND